MTNKRPPLFRLCFWFILAAFVVLTGWWILHIPYDEDALRYAVPADAVFVSRHERLAARWRDIASNSAVRAIGAAYGLELGDMAEGPAVVELDRWLDFLAPRTTIVAYAPQLAGAQAPAWTVSSWIGGRSLLLRAGLGLGSARELRRVRMDGGGSIWVVELPSRTSGARWFSFSVMDGVLFGCLAEDPEAARWLLYKMQGRVPAVRHPAFDDGMRDAASWVAQDAGWLRQWSGDAATELRYGLRQLDRGGLEGAVVLDVGRELSGRAAVDAGDGAELAAVRREVGRLFAAPPDLVAVGQYAAVATGVRLAGWSRLLTEVVAVLPGLAPRTPMFVAMYGGEASGRILGLRVPTVLVGLKWEDADAFVEGIDVVLDRLNAKNDWGLIPRQVRGNVPAVVIDATRGGAYSSLSEGERVTVAGRDGYLLVASNLRALQELVAVRGERSASSEAAYDSTPRGLWRPDAGIPSGADVYLQADCARAGQSIQDALAVATLGLLVNDHPQRASRLKALAAARSRVEWMQELGRVAAWIDVGNESVTVDLRVDGVDGTNKTLEGGEGMR